MKPLSAGKTTKLNFALPSEMKVRLIRQAANESLELGIRITPSDIIRRAVLAYFERMEE